jgi:hypothetical protein
VRTTLAIWVALLWLIGPAFAEITIVQPNDRVPGRADITYFDLMRLVVTDLDANAKDAPTAEEIVRYRHIEGDKAKTEPAGPVAIKYLEPLDIHAEGASRLVLMADLGPSDENVAEFVLLAMFDVTGKPKLLDVVEVGRDRLTGFGSPALTSLGNGTDLINIDSDHFNSNEDFVGNEYLFVRNDRFELVESLFTFDVKMCEFAITEEPTVTAHHVRGETYNRIVLSVREKREATPNAEQCDNKPPRPFTRNYGAVYRWDARRLRFVEISGNMKKLDAENDKLMNPD